MSSTGLVSPADICVVGRTSFSSGIGTVVYGAIELLSRVFKVSMLPIEPEARHLSHIVLPNGREIAVCKNAADVKVWFFADVVWNGSWEWNVGLVPKTGLRIAHFVFDSDELASEQVDRLNAHFDCCLVMSSYLVDVCKRSGVTIPIGVLPLALDLDHILSQPRRDRGGPKVKFLSLAAFHPRKDSETLVRGFAQGFGNDPNVELRIHSNLRFENSFERLSAIVDELALDNVVLSCAEMSAAERDDLLRESDVYVSCSRGEGYGIGAREALAFGKRLVLNATGGYLDLMAAPGVRFVEPSIPSPARYPEIDNRVLGRQYGLSIADLATALLETREDILRRREDGGSASDEIAAREYAGQFSFSRMWPAYAESIDISLGRLRPSTNLNEAFELPPDYVRKTVDVLSAPALRFTDQANRVTPMHDGGYFSIFNCFFSNLVWDLKDPSIRRSLPDWDPTRMIERVGSDQFGSFCYGAIDERNFFHKLYEPLFGVSEETLDSTEALYENAAPRDVDWNAYREPLLTHVNAYRLYLHPKFPRWRKEYHRVYSEHIHLRPHLQKELDTFWSSASKGRAMFAAHVRHPSHLIEQPGAAVAHTRSYIQRILARVTDSGFKEDGDDWGVFLATDQERTVQTFIEELGEDRVAYFRDVRRTTLEEDRAFETASGKDQALQGHQVQHLTASDRSKWSSRMAWEIIRDASAIARCRALFHIVSNVSTAVSYMNPDIELNFIR
jgi:glycosyltransferase involved in cell wall biosynthesis